MATRWSSDFKDNQWWMVNFGLDQRLVRINLNREARLMKSSIKGTESMNKSPPFESYFFHAFDSDEPGTDVAFAPLFSFSSIEINPVVVSRRSSIRIWPNAQLRELLLRQPLPAMRVQKKMRTAVQWGMFHICGSYGGRNNISACAPASVKVFNGVVPAPLHIWWFNPPLCIIQTATVR
jgi:hypothetical protein